MRPIDASLRFLNRWYGNQPRVLTAIDPDVGYIRTEGFTADDEAGERRFIERWRPSRGLYFQVNPDLRAAADIASKGKKEHVSRAIVLHCDIDSYKDGETREDGKARVLRALTDDFYLPMGIPGSASAINDSGNGIHAFWFLREPVDLNGDVAKAEALVEPCNRALALAFGGDATTDVSRILRLPWSINYPNAAKRSLGLTPILTRQVLFDPTRRFDLSEFPRVEGSGARYVSVQHEQSAARIQIGDPEPVESLDQLRVPDRTKVLIAVPVAVGMRSGRLRSVILSMIGCGETNETILGVLTDPRWAISESVLEKDDEDGYARRQIARAHAWRTAQADIDFDAEVTAQQAAPIVDNSERRARAPIKEG